MNESMHNHNPYCYMTPSVIKWGGVIECRACITITPTAYMTPSVIKWGGVIEGD